MTFEEMKNLDHEEYGLLFDVRRSVRYHDRRSAFLESASILGALFVGVGIAGAGIAGIEGRAILAFLSILLALSGELMRVSACYKSALHTILRRRFSELERRIIKGPASGGCWTDYQAERLQIEMDEPMVFKMLDTQCHNELLRVYGFKNSSHNYIRINWWQRLTCQLWPWANAYEMRPKECPQKDEFSCQNKRQCWEPCGELGKSAEHVLVHGAPDNN